MMAVLSKYISTGNTDLFSSSFSFFLLQSHIFLYMSRVLDLGEEILLHTVTVESHRRYPKSSQALAYTSQSYSRIVGYEYFGPSLHRSVGESLKMSREHQVVSASSFASNSEDSPTLTGFHTNISSLSGSWLSKEESNPKAEGLPKGNSEGTIPRAEDTRKTVWGKRSLAYVTILIASVDEQGSTTYISAVEFDQAGKRIPGVKIVLQIPRRVEVYHASLSRPGPRGEQIVCTTERVEVPTVAEDDFDIISPTTANQVREQWDEQQKETKRTKGIRTPWQCCGGKEETVDKVHVFIPVDEPTTPSSKTRRAREDDGATVIPLDDDENKEQTGGVTHALLTELMTEKNGNVGDDKPQHPPPPVSTKRDQLLKVANQYKFQLQLYGCLGKAENSFIMIPQNRRHGAMLALHGPSYPVAYFIRTLSSDPIGLLVVNENTPNSGVDVLEVEYDTKSRCLSATKFSSLVEMCCWHSFDPVKQRIAFFVVDRTFLTIRILQFNGYPQKKRETIFGAQFPRKSVINPAIGVVPMEHHFGSGNCTWSTSLHCVLLPIRYESDQEELALCHQVLPEVGDSMGIVLCFIVLLRNFLSEVTVKIELPTPLTPEENFRVAFFFSRGLIVVFLPGVFIHFVDVAHLEQLPTNLFTVWLLNTETCFTAADVVLARRCHFVTLPLPNCNLLFVPSSMVMVAPDICRRGLWSWIIEQSRGFYRSSSFLLCRAAHVACGHFPVRWNIDVGSGVEKRKKIETANFDSWLMEKICSPLKTEMHVWPSEFIASVISNAAYSLTRYLVRGSCNPYWTCLPFSPAGMDGADEELEFTKQSPCETTIPQQPYSSAKVHGRTLVPREISEIHRNVFSKPFGVPLSGEYESFVIPTKKASVLVTKPPHDNLLTDDEALRTPCDSVDSRLWMHLKKFCHLTPRDFWMPQSILPMERSVSSRFQCFFLAGAPVVVGNRLSGFDTNFPCSMKSISTLLMDRNVPAGHAQQLGFRFLGAISNYVNQVETAITTNGETHRPEKLLLLAQNFIVALSMLNLDSSPMDALNNLIIRLSFSILPPISLLHTARSHLLPMIFSSNDLVRVGTFNNGSNLCRLPSESFSATVSPIAITVHSTSRAPAHRSILAATSVHQSSSSIVSCPVSSTCRGMSWPQRCWTLILLVLAASFINLFPLNPNIREIILPIYCGEI